MRLHPQVCYLFSYFITSSSCLSSLPFPSEPPQFIKEPEKHITAEMEKVVDIPCQARGEHRRVSTRMSERIKSPLSEMFNKY